MWGKEEKGEFYSDGKYRFEDGEEVRWSLLGRMGLVEGLVVSGVGPGAAVVGVEDCCPASRFS